MATQTVITGDQIVPRYEDDRVLPRDAQNSIYTARIVLKSRGRILLLPVSNICWIGAEENYVRICTANESHLLRETMTSMERRLDPKQFVRVHRCAIVNLSYVRELGSKTRGECIVHLENGHSVPLSRSYRARIGELLNQCAARPLARAS